MTINKRREISADLQQVLSKMKHVKQSSTAPVVYTPAEILAAKEVLDRLLSMSSKSEVVSVKPDPIVIKGI